MNTNIYDIILRTLTKYDLMHLNCDCAPLDEYDPEAKVITDLITTNGYSETKLRKWVDDTFNEYFEGLYKSSVESELVAVEICNLLNKI